MTIAFFLCLFTKRQPYAPTLDDIIGKERDYTKPIGRQHPFGAIGGDDHVCWVEE